MIREAVELVESKTPSILKYIPKKLGKKYTTAKAEAEAWIEIMKYPFDAGYFGHYGKDEGKLEFNIKTHLDFDMDEVKALLNTDEEDVYQMSDNYLELQREDLEESLKSEFGCAEFSYSGRQGGYILIKDYDEAIFGGMGLNEISPWNDDNYGDPVDEIMEWVDDIETLMTDLEGEGPLGENWDTYIADLNEMIDEGVVTDYDLSNKKGALKVMAKNYTKLETFIEKAKSSVESGFMDYVKDNLDELK